MQYFKPEVCYAPLVYARFPSSYDSVCIKVAIKKRFASGNYVLSKESTMKHLSNGKLMTKVTRIKGVVVSSVKFSYIVQ